MIIKRTDYYHFSPLKRKKCKKITIDINKTFGGEKNKIFNYKKVCSNVFRRSKQST